MVISNLNDDVLVLPKGQCQTEIKDLGPGTAPRSGVDMLEERSTPTSKNPTGHPDTVFETQKFLNFHLFRDWTVQGLTKWC